MKDDFTALNTQLNYYKQIQQTLNVLMSSLDADNPILPVIIEDLLEYSKSINHHIAFIISTLFDKKEGMRLFNKVTDELIDGIHKSAEGFEVDERSDKIAAMFDEALERIYSDTKIQNVVFDRRGSGFVDIYKHQDRGTQVKLDTNGLILELLVLKAPSLDPEKSFSSYPTVEFAACFREDGSMVAEVEYKPEEPKKEIGLGSVLLGTLATLATLEVVKTAVAKPKKPSMKVEQREYAEKTI